MIRILLLILIYFSTVFSTQAQKPNNKTILFNNIPSFVPASMRGNPPDIYVNYKTNQAWIKNNNKTTTAASVTNVSRASAATQVDSSGNWIQCLSSVLCRTDLGASIWEARTNSIRNNTMAGAVVMADSVQLLSNNNFASQGTGWTVGQSGGGSVVFAVGSATITGDGVSNGNYISQQINGLTIGRNYIISVTGGGQVAIAVGVVSGGTTVLAFTNAASNGNNSTLPDRVGFTATSTSHWVSVARFTATPTIINALSVQDGERIQDNTFSANPINAAQNTVQNGWQWSVAGGTSTVTWNSVDTVTLTGDGTNLAAIDASFPSAAGFTYTLSVDVGVSTIAVQIGTAKGGSTLLNTTTSTNGTLKFQFTATGTTTWVRFGKTSVASPTIKNVFVTSAGALPTTGWTSSLNSIWGNIVGNVAGVGTESGINYIDFQVVGTPINTFANQSFIAFDTTNVTTATYGQTWAGSSFMTLVSGSLTNVTNISLFVIQRNSSGGFLASSSILNTPVSGSLGNSRTSLASTFTNPATAFTSFDNRMSLTAGSAVNFTVRIGWPQLENNSLISSSVASAVKAADGSGGVDGTAVYSVGGGTGSAATLNVTWAAGVMTVNSVVSAGNYTVFPPSPATLTYVSGAATGWTGATVNLTPTDNASKAVASNPILTTSAAATRVAEADTLILTGLPPIGSAASLWGRFTPLVPASYTINQSVVSLDDGSLNNRINFFRNNGSAGASYRYVAGGVAGLSNGSGSLNSNISNKIAIAGITGDQAGYSNGGNSVTGSGAGFPSATIVHIGVGETGNSTYANSNMEEFAIWFNQRVPNAQLQSMTQ